MESNYIKMLDLLIANKYQKTENIQTILDDYLDEEKISQETYDDYNEQLRNR